MAPIASCQTCFGILDSPEQETEDAELVSA